MLLSERLDETVCTCLQPWVAARCRLPAFSAAAAQPPSRLGQVLAEHEGVLGALFEVYASASAARLRAEEAAAAAAAGPRGKAEAKEAKGAKGTGARRRGSKGRSGQAAPAARQHVGAVAAHAEVRPRLQLAEWLAFWADLGLLALPAPAPPAGAQPAQQQAEARAQPSAAQPLAAGAPAADGERSPGAAAAEQPGPEAQPAATAQANARAVRRRSDAAGRAADSPAAPSPAAATAARRASIGEWAGPLGSRHARRAEEQALRTDERKRSATKADRAGGGYRPAQLQAAFVAALADPTSGTAHGCVREPRALARALALPASDFAQAIARVVDSEARAEDGSARQRAPPPSGSGLRLRPLEARVDALVRQRVLAVWSSMAMIELGTTHLPDSALFLAARQLALRLRSRES